MVAQRAEVYTDVLRDVIRQVEGRLYGWGRCVATFPGAPISKVYEALLEYGLNGPGVNKKGRSTLSPQERWAIQNQHLLETAKIVARTMRKMARLEQTIVWMRYVERKTWVEIAEALSVSEALVKRVLRERILYLFAAEFGLLAPDEEQDDEFVKN